MADHDATTQLLGRGLFTTTATSQQLNYKRNNDLYLQYGRRAVAALKLAADCCADLVLGFYLLLIIYFPSEKCVKIQKG